MKKKIVIKLSGRVFGMDNAKIIQKYADFLIKISKFCQPVVIAGGGGGGSQYYAGGGGGGNGGQGNNTSYAAQTTGGSGIVVIRYQR